jgi:predicted phosphohydrolase
MKFIKWKSDSSEEEDFQVVKSRISKKKERKLKNQSKKVPKELMDILMMVHPPLRGGFLELALNTTSEEGQRGKIVIKNDRSNLEL